MLLLTRYVNFDRKETAMSEIGQSIADIDWGEQWVLERQERHERREGSNAEFWNKRAPKFGTKRGVSPYAATFIEKLALEPNDTVFDMGCGNGAIAIPLAKAGHAVIARDFSIGMLSQLAAQMEAESVTGIDYACMSWEDDWQAHGITDGMVDVAFASRSIITADLKDSLTKLSRVARKRACITISTASSPLVSSGALYSLGAKQIKSGDMLFAFAILVQMGFNPEVSYIESHRFDAFEDYDNAFDSMMRMIEAAERYTSTEDVETMKRNLPDWLHEHLVPNENAGRLNSHDEIEGPLRLDVDFIVRWAFISWEV